MLSIRRHYRPLIGSPIRIVLFQCRIKAGFASPAETYTEKRLDLNELAIKNPAATYILQVSGPSMRDAGILDGDYVVVDRSLTPHPGDIVIAEFGGEFTIKYLGRQNGHPYLYPANPDFQPIYFMEGEELIIMGVVRTVVRNLMP